MAYSYAVGISPGGDRQQPLIKVYNNLLKLRLSRCALTFDGAGVVFFPCRSAVHDKWVPCHHDMARPRVADILE
jgi:hypothetical protein